MSSRTPSRVRVWNYYHILSSGTPTRAHVPGTTGYETTLVGCMRLGAPDQRHGSKVPLHENA